MITETRSIRHSPRTQSGMTMIELLVALAIGSFLIIGTVQIYNQSRQAFIINESIARVQETAQFAMDTIEADLRMASNWGMLSQGEAIEGRSLITDTNPLQLPIPTACGPVWSLNLIRPVEAYNNSYGLLCPSFGGPQLESDIITTRRATTLPSFPQAGTLQIQSSRIQGQVFSNGVIPTDFSAIDSETHTLLVNSYYVALNSELIPGVPTLRRKSLVSLDGTPTIADQEIAPGVQNIQIQLGVDVNKDNTVDRYVNPGNPILNHQNAAFIPDAQVITARIWIVVRGLTPETGIQDAAAYQIGDVTLGPFNDGFRRLKVSKTILLRNART